MFLLSLPPSLFWQTTYLDAAENTKSVHSSAKCPLQGAVTRGALKIFPRTCWIFSLRPIPRRQVIYTGDYSQGFLGNTLYSSTEINTKILILGEKCSISPTSRSQYSVTVSPNSFRYILPSSLTLDLLKSRVNLLHCFHYLPCKCQDLLWGQVDQAKTWLWCKPMEGRIGFIPISNSECDGRNTQMHAKVISGLIFFMGLSIHEAFCPTIYKCRKTDKGV